jgi:hypothetical protein
MLKKSDLFDLIKSLDAYEKRYLVMRGNKEEGAASGYLTLLKEIAGIENYTEEAMKQAIASVSDSDKSEVKKYYFYHWILKHLSDYHASEYNHSRELNSINLLIDRSLYDQANSMIQSVKEVWKKAEKYPQLFAVLELEIKISKYQETSNPLSLLEETGELTKQYADLKALELIKHQFRLILDRNIYVRCEKDKKEIEKITDSSLLSKSNKGDHGLLINYNRNLILYWKNATNCDWEKAYKYALKNYKLMFAESDTLVNLPDESLNTLYITMISSSMSNSRTYKEVVNKIKKISYSEMNSRIKDDVNFIIHFTNLIQFNNHSRENKDDTKVKEAEEYISINRSKFSKIRLNSYYFDLAKAYFYLAEYQKCHSILNEIFQNLKVSGSTLDFYIHSRILDCLACFENESYELIFYTAKATETFMSRKKIEHHFEKRFLHFIMRDLSNFNDWNKQKKISKLEQLKKELSEILTSSYERPVLSFLDYNGWINKKLDLLKEIV